MKIKVHAKADRFRRAGIDFGRGVVELDTRTLTPEQLEAIQSEPMLVVETSEADEPKADEPKGNESKAADTKTKAKAAGKTGQGKAKGRKK